MIEIGYYKEIKNKKTYYCVDIIIEKTGEIVRSEKFKNIKDAFEYSREYEEDILGVDFEEDVWEMKYEIMRLCYESSDNEKEFIKNQERIWELQMALIERCVGKDKLDSIFEAMLKEVKEQSKNLIDVIEEVKSEYDIN